MERLSKKDEQTVLKLIYECATRGGQPLIKVGSEPIYKRFFDDPNSISLTFIPSRGTFKKPQNDVLVEYYNINNGNVYKFFISKDRKWYKYSAQDISQAISGKDYNKVMFDLLQVVCNNVMSLPETVDYIKVYKKLKELT